MTRTETVGSHPRPDATQTRDAASDSPDPMLPPDRNRQAREVLSERETCVNASPSAKTSWRPQGESLASTAMALDVPLRVHPAHHGRHHWKPCVRYDLVRAPHHLHPPVLPSGDTFKLRLLTRPRTARVPGLPSPRLLPKAIGCHLRARPKPRVGWRDPRVIRPVNRSDRVRDSARKRAREATQYRREVDRHRCCHPKRILCSASKIIPSRTTTIPRLHALARHRWCCHQQGFGARLTDVATSKSRARPVRRQTTCTQSPCLDRSRGWLASHTRPKPSTLAFQASRLAPTVSRRRHWPSDEAVNAPQRTAARPANDVTTADEPRRTRKSESATADTSTGAAEL